MPFLLSPGCLDRDERSEGAQQVQSLSLNSGNAGLNGTSWRNDDRAGSNIWIVPSRNPNALLVQLEEDFSRCNSIHGTSIHDVHLKCSLQVVLAVVAPSTAARRDGARVGKGVGDPSVDLRPVDAGDVPGSLSNLVVAVKLHAPLVLAAFPRVAVVQVGMHVLGCTGDLEGIHVRSGSVAGGFVIQPFSAAAWQRGARSADERRGGTTSFQASQCHFAGVGILRPKLDGTQLREINVVFSSLPGCPSLQCRSHDGRGDKRNESSKDCRGGEELVMHVVRD